MPSSTRATLLPAEPPRVGDTLALHRERQGLSMDELSRRAGVSKSMLSQIERSQANPTVAVVWRLANALGLPLAELLGGPAIPERPLLTTVPVQSTPTLQAPDGRHELRILGPIELAGQFEWYELRMQPGGALRSQAHEPGSQEHLTVLSGSLEVEAGGQRSVLRSGETARYAADRPHAISNTSRHGATALLVVLHKS